MEIEAEEPGGVDEVDPSTVVVIDLPRFPAMTPTETGSPTCHVTSSSEDKSRLFVDFLLDDGENTALLDALAIDTDTEDIDDVTGWGCSVSLPRPPLNETRRAAPVGGSLGGGLRKKSYKQNQAAEMDLSNMKVRCVNEDFVGDHQKSAWKANVEPGTYRYISNNGIYRSNKFANTGNDWVTAKRSRHIENNSSGTTNPNVKHAQKTLRKDLDQHFKLAEQLKNENNLPPSTPGHNQRDPRLHNSHQYHQQQQQKEDNNTTKHETDSLPPPSRPPKDPKLVKSASDLFVENFSSRLSALEKSEKDANNSNNTPVPRTPSSSHKSGLSSSNVNNHNKRFTSEHNDIDDISKDVFTVRPVTRAPDQPLGPLEKLTPQQKLLERAGESECNSVQSKSQPESPSLPPSFMTAMNAFAQIHNKPAPQHHYRNKDSSSKAHSRSNPNTHRHPYKSSSMSNVSDTDSSINSVRNALTQTNSNIERMRMGSYGKSPVKDYGRFLSSSRPKVAPQSTTHTSAFGRTIGNHQTGSNNYNHSAHGFTGSGAGLIGSNVHKNTVVGYKSLSTSAPVGSTIRPSHGLSGSNAIQPVVTSNANLQVEDVSCGVSETESYLSGTSLNVNRGSGSLRDGKGGGGHNMALPGISGKRMAVAATTQRML